MSRRGFVLATGAGIGLVVGYGVLGGIPGGESEGPGWSAPAGETALNAWLRIAEDGQVTVAVPQAEMGQGILSAFAQIVADELGAAWDRMAVAPAPWQPAYANTGLVGEAVRDLPRTVRPIFTTLGDRMVRRANLHLTAGSTSVRSYHAILRQMAAEARARLAAVAARSWGVPVAEVKAHDSILVHGDRTMPFREAVAKLDGAATAAKAVLRDHPGNLLGEPLPRIDLPAKVNGSARFGADIRLPGMVFAAVRHGPIGGHLIAVEGDGAASAVRGENWVATTGMTTFAARRAVELLKPRFSKGDAELTTAAINRRYEEALREALDLGGAGLADATGAPVAATYRVPFLAHAPAEPLVATAREADGVLEVWGPTQSLTFAHAQLARALSLAESRILVHPTLVGCGYGRALETACMVEAALIARAVGKPVQLAWTRGEDMGEDAFRPAALARMEGRVGAGKIAGLAMTVATPAMVPGFRARNVGSAADGIFDRTAGKQWEEGGTPPYALPAFKRRDADVSVALPLGYWRGARHGIDTFFVECFMDELAQAAGADPVAFRRAHLAGKPRHRAVLDAVRAAATRAGAPAKGMGQGVALADAFGSVVATLIEAGVADGRISLGRVFVAVDCGAVVNPDTVRQMAEGGTITGLSAALGEEATFRDGRIIERSLRTYPVLGMKDAPAGIFTIILKSDAPFGGVAELAVPPAAPALANALFAATGKRWRTLPFGRHAPVPPGSAPHG